MVAIIIVVMIIIIIMAFLLLFFFSIILKLLNSVKYNVPFSAQFYHSVF